jgi:hypothetical protein
MLKVTFAILAVMLASTASAAGWRSLRIDARNEAAFKESVATFEAKLSPSRRVAFARSLQDVWIEGTQRAAVEQREYTSADYFRQLDGLGYEEVVKITDPTGQKAKRYRAEYDNSRAPALNPMPGPSGGPAPPPVENGAYRGATRAIDGGVRTPLN